MIQYSKWWPRSKSKAKLQLLAHVESLFTSCWTPSPKANREIERRIAVARTKICDSRFPPPAEKHRVQS
uniref:Uncharacterized protein n=1 Tax=Arundo donax TaxID=35708 RepID=A0A0A9CIN9_ARUDO